MNKRPSIYMGETLQNIVKGLKGSHDDKVSSVINAMADRYSHCISKSMPVLTVNEWLAIMDVLNGYVTDNISIAVQGIHWNLADGIEMEKLGEKWGISLEFAARVRDMSVAEKIAILDARDRFWSGNIAKTDNYRDMLIECGCKIAD